MLLDLLEAVLAALMSLVRSPKTALLLVLITSIIAYAALA
jgi:hypothetical protein